ncbi:HDOD domain-containing protein [Oleiharenicola lentus]|uniref:HDOD domain-containing protein n=1 Tax=Oleiharenicola lentus TaxID=2508720 RepID=A0A4Q1C415_9BACT|nr:HDOD domain-containing protein [Oleiharenicola lentus]RXK52989.1 HDOD domain-containing protein [Oleiharenicola lentus]
MPANLPPTLDKVCDAALKLPCAPSLLPKLALALQSDDSSSADIERLISLDASLAASTLRLANSAAMGGGKVTTVEEAVFRLGAKEIYRLAALALVGRWESGAGKGLRWSPGDFSRHALITAIAAEMLAATTERLDPQLAYTSGLVSDVGKLALAHSCADFYPAVRVCAEQTRCTWEQAERTVLGYHHADASIRLLNAWNFPSLFVLAVEHQFAPASAPVAALPLLAHLHAAKYLATSMGPGVMEEGFMGVIHGAFLKEWGFTPEMLEATMPIVLEKASARLGERLHEGSISL